MLRKLNGSRKASITALSCSALLACSTVGVPSPTTILTGEQFVDMAVHPARWHRRIVTMRIYPYDLGFSRSDQGWSYALCFEPCSRPAAERSVSMVRSRTDRFAGYVGDRGLVTQGTWVACNVDFPCADLWVGVFYPVENLRGERPQRAGSGSLDIQEIGGSSLRPIAPRESSCRIVRNGTIANRRLSRCIKRGRGAPKRIRTSGLCLRRAALYPAELWVHRREAGP